MNEQAVCCEGLAQGVLHLCTFPNVRFVVQRDGDRVYLQVETDTVCNDTGTPYPNCRGRKWQLSAHMTRSEIVATAFKAVMAFIEHETREQFRYRGKAVFGPHIDVEALWRIADNTDERKPAEEAQP